MMQRFRSYLLFCLFMAALVPSALAVLSGYQIQREAAGDPDYAAGLTAFEHADWQGVIDSMTRVIERRPWQDNAHSLMGFAYRKLGDYRRSLEHYQKALELNPYNRGALAYLGETYLEMGHLAEAKRILDRLKTACDRIADSRSQNDGQSHCQEWQELRTAIDAYIERIESGDASNSE